MNDPLATNSAVASGEMHRLIWSKDWSQTPLGAPNTWSPTLRTMVDFLLANRFPLLLWWGGDYLCIYNDAYIPVLGRKHPWALGLPVREVWSEIWPVLQPLIDTPFHGGPSTWIEDFELILHRKGFTEECHFTVAYSPVPDVTAPSGIGGVLATVHEITEKVIGERRVVALRDLGTRAAEARTAEDACQVAAETLARHSKDVPFALLYLIDPDGRHARLAGAAGPAPADANSSPVVRLDAADEPGLGWPLAEAVRTGAMVTVSDLGARFAVVPPSPWADPPHTAVVVPIRSNKAHELAGLLVAGVSARLALNEQYLGFLELVAAQIATAIANARSYEEERKRAEALAELDRAKTAFFSNVSHEFRTPLTLLLGPLQDALNGPEAPESAPQRERLEVAHRNGLRLLKLVNSLLDFARIEAGRVEASYAPTDLAALTADLASVFRSAIERAGLRLVVDCPPLPEPVYVDSELWEKIVLNLLSNAFKFTFHGEICVSLRWASEAVQLQVRDTGIGIGPEDLPQLFTRFHRIRGAQARTHEGTGIGLALVQELVRLHGGSIQVESELGQGTVFTVSVPTGQAHLPARQVEASPPLQSTALGAAPFVEEALRWLPEEKAEGGRRKDEELKEEVLPSSFILPPSSFTARPSSRILVVDDNADMRAYLRRLLGQQWSVSVVEDGAAALAQARTEPPDLVLADVMMPGLDGFELLRALRADEKTRTLPVVLLSARAGEEARIEGLHAGADDYLVKPFGAQELVARVGAQLEMARLRRELLAQARTQADQLRLITDALPVLISYVDAQQRYQFNSRSYLDWFGLDPATLRGQHLRDVLGEEAHAAIQPYVLAALSGQLVSFEAEVPYLHGGSRSVMADYVPHTTAKGETLGFYGLVTDITERKRREANSAFLSEVSQDLAQLTNIDDTLDALGDKIRAHLHAFHFHFGVVDEEQQTVTHEWKSAEAPSLTSTHRIVDVHTEDFRRAMRAGETYVVRDASQDPRTNAEQLAAFSIGAFVSVSIVRDGEWRFALSIFEPAPRDWHPDEIELMRELAARIWARLERARTEAALREFDIRFRTLADSSPVLLWQNGLKGAEFVNRAYLDFLGVAPADVLNFDWARFIHAEDHQAYVDAYLAAFAQRAPFSAQLRFLRADGEYRWMKSDGLPRFSADGEFLGYVGSTLDVSDLKQAEQQIAALNEQLRGRVEELQTILQVLPVGLFIAHDPECATISSNPAGAAMLGLDPEANASKTGPQGAQLPFRVLKDGVEVPNDALPMQVAARTGQPLRGDVLDIVRADGKVITVHEDAAPLFDAAGRPRGCVAAFTDISARRELEQERAQYAHQLEERVAERTGELQASNQALEHSQDELRRLSAYQQQAIEAERTRMAREIHDELGQQLTGLKMDVAALKKRLAPDDGVLRDQAQNIIQAVNITIQAVRRLATDLRPAILDDFGLTAALEWQVQDFERRSNIRCTLEETVGDLLLEPDTRTAIFRVFQETLTNVARHAQATEVAVRFEVRDNTLLLNVRDNGRGISQRQVSGTGSLGLLGMRERVRLLDGEITMEGVPGQGTTILVKIPLRPGSI